MQLSDSFKDQLAEKFGDLAGEEDGGADDAARGQETASTLARIAGLVEKLSGFPAADVTPAHRAEDLGLGSLQRIELVVRLEQDSGVRIDDREVAGLNTVGELAEYVDTRA